MFASTKYLSDGINYYPVSAGLSNDAYETPASACGNPIYQQKYTPDNGYAVGGSCSTAGSTFTPPNNLGYVCDGSNVWVDANFNIGGNNWDSKTVADACNACQEITKNNGSQRIPTVPQYLEIGDCVNGTGSFYYDIASDGNRWFYTLFSQPTGNTNPSLACQYAQSNAALKNADLTKGKPCSSLDSAPVFNYDSPAQPSGSAINAMIASAIEPFTLFNNTKNKTAQMIVLGLLLIAILVLIYFLIQKEEKKEMEFYFC